MVEAGYGCVVDLLAEIDHPGAELLEGARPFALNYLAFPSEHRRWIRTNNIQERMNAEIKRRMKVVRVFPPAASLLRLAGAVCCNQNDAWLSSKNFIDRRSLAEGCEPRERADARQDVPRVLTAVREAFRKKQAA